MSKQAVTEQTISLAGMDARYPQIQAALHSAGGAWVREASLALALAAQARISLDEQTLIYSDVRDLMALQWRLRAHAARR